MAVLSRQARLLNNWCMDMSPTMMIRRFAVHCRKSSRSHGLKSHTYGLNTCNQDISLSAGRSSAVDSADVNRTSMLEENAR